MYKGVRGMRLIPFFIFVSIIGGSFQIRGAPCEFHGQMYKNVTPHVCVCVCVCVCVGKLWVGPTGL